MPFSACSLPYGTTRLELVISGRSVAIWSALVGQRSAAPAFARQVTRVVRRSAHQSSRQRFLMSACFDIPAFRGRDIERTSLGQGFTLVRRSRSPRLAIEVGDRARRLVCRSPLRRFWCRRELLPFGV